jgi:hypothetical protein
MISTYFEWWGIRVDRIHASDPAYQAILQGFTDHHFAAPMRPPRPPADGVFFPTVPPVAFRAQHGIPQMRWYYSPYTPYRRAWRGVVFSVLSIVHYNVITQHMNRPRNPGVYGSLLNGLVAFLFSLMSPESSIVMALLTGLRFAGALSPRTPLLLLDSWNVFKRIEPVPSIGRGEQFLRIVPSLLVASTILRRQPWWYSVFRPQLDYPWIRNPTLRAQFRNFTIQSAAPNIGITHSHPYSAMYRNDMDGRINTFIRNAGYEIYSLQCSSVDEKRGIRGCFTHYWSKDKMRSERYDPIPDRPFFKLIDVDYYINWTEYLWMCAPFIIYTFSPQDPAGTVHDYSWCTRPDGSIYMEVTGGAVYSHHLWNYEIEACVAQYPGVTIHYSVDSFRPHANREVVLLVPCSIMANSELITKVTIERRCLVVKTETPSTRFAASEENKKNALLPLPNRLMKGNVMPAQKLVAIIRQQNPNMEPYLSIAPVAMSTAKGSASVRIRQSLATAFEARCRSRDASDYDMQTFIAADFQIDQRSAASILFDNFPLSPVDYSKVSTRVSAIPEIRAKTNSVSYGRTPDTHRSDDSRPMGFQVSPPVYPRDLIPVRSTMNDKWCIAERVEKVHNPLSDLKPSDEPYISDFINYLIPQPGMLAPLDLDTILKEQDRPNQKVKNRVAVHKLAEWSDDMKAQDYKTVVQSFQKAEAYQADEGLKPPRNISTFDTEHCLTYSKYTKPLSEHIKQFEWYAFGHHPNEVARKVHDIAAQSKDITCTDYSKFDGTHSEALYKLEERILLRAFAPESHEEIKNLHRMMRTAKGRTAFGVKYDLAGSRPSGAADTSIMNTIDNSFFNYIAWRRDGMSHIQAMHMMDTHIITGGDDGLVGDSAVTYPQVCSDYGTILKVKRQPATHPADFLGRIWPTPMLSPMNMCDVRRQISKLHISHSMDPIYQRNPEHVLVNRANGILVMDPETPLISDWARMILRLYPGFVSVHPESWMQRWFDNSPNAYPVDYEIALEIIIAQLDVTRGEVLDYIAHLKTIKSISELRPLKSLMEPVPPAGHFRGTTYGLNSEDLPVDPQPGTGLVNADAKFTSIPEAYRAQLAELPPDPFVPKYDQMVYVPKTVTYSTPPLAAAQQGRFFARVIEFLVKKSPNSAPFDTFYDCTAHVGVDFSIMHAVLTQLKRPNNMVACETDRVTYQALQRNVAPLIALKARHIKVVNAVNPPVVGQNHLLYFDPPWDAKLNEFKFKARKDYNLDQLLKEFDSQHIIVKRKPSDKKVASRKPDFTQDIKVNSRTIFRMEFYCRASDGNRPQYVCNQCYLTRIPSRTYLKMKKKHGKVLCQNCQKDQGLRSTASRRAPEAKKTESKEVKMPPASVTPNSSPSAPSLKLETAGVVVPTTAPRFTFDTMAVPHFTFGTSSSSSSPFTFSTAANSGVSVSAAVPEPGPGTNWAGLPERSPAVVSPNDVK